MSKLSRWGALALFGAASAVTLVVPGVASAATATGQAAAMDSSQYCVLVVGKPTSPDAISPVLYRYCSTKSIEDATAHLRSAQIQRSLGRGSISADDLLMTWFQHSDYGGDQTDIYGGEGTCDTAGYRLEPNWWWEDEISSAAGFAQCDIARFTNKARNYAATFDLPVKHLGQALNDNVGLIQVYHSED